jgi:tetratricopeptide (TPR) repeat protein
MKLVALLLALAVATPAHAGVWDDASRTEQEQDAQDTYDLAMRLGDDAVLVANVEGGSKPERKEQLQHALDAYRRAADAKPTSAEPYFRIAEAIHSFYIDACPDPGLPPQFQWRSPFRDCDNPDQIDQRASVILLDAWAKAEERAPLDPRFSAGEGSILFDRAIIYTKLGGEQNWRLAAKIYEDFIRLVDNRDTDRLQTTWSNLGETYMMLGQLDESIDAYREALRISFGTGISTAYGLAVAFDRAGRAEDAKRLVKAEGEEAWEAFSWSVSRGNTFFVPFGEGYYYEALVLESWGYYDLALQMWRAFITSGAHPRYQARAREHVDAIITMMAGQVKPDLTKRLRIGR